MDDLKKLTVRYLRALARKHIGEGHSKLKTKAQLLAALKNWLPDFLQPKSPRRAKAGARSGKAAAKVIKLAGGARKTPVGEPGGSEPASRPSDTPGQQRSEPLIEGFFVARVAGEDEVRRHRLTEASTMPSSRSSGGDSADGLGEQEGDMRLRAVARDPATLFAFWDFPKASWQRAARGLRSPRAVLRVFEGSQLVRELEIAAESRSFYVHHLTAGQRYRVEAHVRGADGRSRQVGLPSDMVELPRTSESKGEARFGQLAWGSDLRSLNSGPVRIIDQPSAERLAGAFRPQSSVGPLGGSSERRSNWLFSPSGSGGR